MKSKTSNRIDHSACILKACGAQFSMTSTTSVVEEEIGDTLGSLLGRLPASQPTCLQSAKEVIRIFSKLELPEKIQ